MASPIGDGFIGLYRAIVRENVDPLQQARLRLEIPDVLGALVSTWAMPCVPIAHSGMGMYVVPPVGAAVWVAFEGGDPGYPVWVGCYWSNREDLPAHALDDTSVQNVVLRTSGGQYAVLSDSPGNEGGIRLVLSSGPSLTMSGTSIRVSAGSSSITLDDTGITLDNGSGATIGLSGPTVNINNEALSIT